jgi:hypothetical protein
MLVTPTARIASPAASAAALSAEDAVAQRFSAVVWVPWGSVSQCMAARPVPSTAPSSP